MKYEVTDMGYKSIKIIFIKFSKEEKDDEK